MSVRVLHNRKLFEMPKYLIRVSLSRHLGHYPIYRDPLFLEVNGNVGNGLYPIFLRRPRAYDVTNARHESLSCFVITDSTRVEFVANWTWLSLIICRKYL